MPTDKASTPIHRVRKKDRAVGDEAWIRGMLHRSAYGVLATVHDGQPFVNSNLYVYDESADCIYLHTAKKGRTRANIEAEPRVCFTVNEIGRVLPGETGYHFSLEYAGVVVFGKAGIVADRDQAKSALQMLLDKYASHLRPGRDYGDMTDDELALTSVFRIVIEHYSGKGKEVAADFPGAFTYSPAADSTGEA